MLMLIKHTLNKLGDQSSQQTGYSTKSRLDEDSATKLVLLHIFQDKRSFVRDKNPLGKLEKKIFRNQNFSEGVETFVDFVMGETPDQHCNNKIGWRKPLSDNKSVGESKIIKPKRCWGI